MATGVNRMPDMAGKMQKISGKEILTGSSEARRSASSARFLRNSSE